jgi:hypothetical protein
MLEEFSGTDPIADRVPNSCAKPRTDCGSDPVRTLQQRQGPRGLEHGIPAPPQRHGGVQFAGRIQASPAHGEGAHWGTVPVEVPACVGAVDPARRQPSPAHAFVVFAAAGAGAGRSEVFLLDVGRPQ